MSKQKTVMVVGSDAPLALQKGDISSKYAALLASTHKEWSLISIADLQGYLEKNNIFQTPLWLFPRASFFKIGWYELSKSGERQGGDE